MKLSVFHQHVVEAARQTGMSQAQVLEKVRSWGIEGLEYDWADIRGHRDEVRRVLVAHGLSVSSVYGFFDFGTRFDADEVRAFVDDAHFLGAQKVLVIPGFVDPQASPSLRTAALTPMVAALRAVCDLAEPLGITVTMEDFDNEKAPFSTDRELLWFLEQVPKLGCTFDTGNFFYQGIDERVAFEVLKPRIVHVHCKDRSKTFRPGEQPAVTKDGSPMASSAVGSGCIALGEVLAALKDLGYDGYLAIEHFNSPDQLGDMESSARWLTRHWKG